MSKAAFDILAEFDQTVGEYTVDVFKVNSKQNSTLKISRLSQNRVHIIIVNRNYYYEKGNTFNNWVTLYDETGEPIHAFYSQRGVGERRPTRGSRKGKTNFQSEVPKEILDQVKYVRMYSDNKGNSNRILEQIGDAIKKGALKAVEDFAKDRIKLLLPTSEDAKKALVGAAKGG